MRNVLAFIVGAVVFFTVFPLLRDGHLPFTSPQNDYRAGIDATWVELPTKTKNLICSYRNDDKAMARFWRVTEASMRGDVGMDDDMIAKYRAGIGAKITAYCDSRAAAKKKVG